MFAMAYDTAFGLAVFLFTPDNSTDADFEGYVAGIELVKNWHRASTSGVNAACAILVVEPGSVIPNAHWRKRIAEVSKDVKPPAFFAVVSTSAIVRGTVTAINWLRPPPYEVAIVATFTAAVEWVEGKRGVKLALLHDLLKEARERAARGEQFVPRPTGRGRADA